MHRSTPTPVNSARGELRGVRDALDAAVAVHQRLGEVNPRPPGLYNHAIQLVKKTMGRSLSWYTRPNYQFQEEMLELINRMILTLQGQGEAIQELRDGLLQATNGRSTGSLDEQHEVLPSIPTDFPRGGLDQSRLLRENDKIIAYWDSAARNDPMRETVTQWAHESNEEYLQNWKKVGEYVAGKIMSYSPPNPVALEIGPGMGRITIPMSYHCQSITALDISSEMARRAREAFVGLKNVEVQVITDEDLSFLPSERFDLAYAIATFQHAEKKSFYRYLRGIRRALKGEGVLFFGVMNLCSERGWEHFQAIVENDYPEFFHTPDEIACYLAHAGYRSHQLEYEGETMWAIAHR